MIFKFVHYHIYRCEHKNSESRFDYRRQAGDIILFATSIQWLPGLKPGEAWRLAIHLHLVLKLQVSWLVPLTPIRLHNEHRDLRILPLHQRSCSVSLMPLLRGGSSRRWLHSATQWSRGKHSESVWTNGPLPHHITLISHLALIQRLWIHSGSHIFSLSALGCRLTSWL
jgi:hypothetical protein